jgi:hypothetical protein
MSVKQFIGEKFFSGYSTFAPLIKQKSKRSRAIYLLIKNIKLQPQFVLFSSKALKVHLCPRGTLFMYIFIYVVIVLKEFLRAFFPLTHPRAI